MKWSQAPINQTASIFVSNNTSLNWYERSPDKNAIYVIHLDRRPLYSAASKRNIFFISPPEAVDSWQNIRRLTGIRACIFNYIHYFLWGVITLHNCNYGLPVKIGYRSKITSQSFMGCSQLCMPCISCWIISWWCHQMEIFSALLVLCEGIHRLPVDYPHKGHWRGALMFSWSVPELTFE